VMKRINNAVHHSYRQLSVLKAATRPIIAHMAS
jgi:hypothetical protein